MKDETFLVREEEEEEEEEEDNETEKGERRGRMMHHQKVVSHRKSDERFVFCVSSFNALPDDDAGRLPCFDVGGRRNLPDDVHSGGSLGGHYVKCTGGGGAAAVCFGAVWWSVCPQLALVLACTFSTHRLSLSLLF